MGSNSRRKCGLVLSTTIITVQLRLIRTLRGLTPDFGSFNDAEFDESRFEQRLESNPRAGICRVLVLDSQAASALLRRRLRVCDRGRIESCSRCFGPRRRKSSCLNTISTLRLPGRHAAMTLQPRSDPSIWKRSWRIITGRSRSGRRTARQTFANRAALVGAEIARLEGRELDAERLYEAGHPLGARARLRPERGPGP